MGADQRPLPWAAARAPRTRDDLLAERKATAGLPARIAATAGKTGIDATPQAFLAGAPGIAAPRCAAAETAARKHPLS